MRQESAAKCILVGLGMMVAGLGLIFSLSRSGIAAAVAGLAIFALLARSRLDEPQTGVLELRRHGKEPSARVQREAKRAVHRVWAFGLLVTAVTIWIGMNPVAQRFGGLADRWETENGRQQVWLDSSGAVTDFWLTGSGLGSFQHVFPIYRSFGGVHAYTHAHNDYLQLLVELGAPGLLLVLWLIVSIWIGAHRAREGLQGDAASLYLHAGYCAAVVAIALHSSRISACICPRTRRSSVSCWVSSWDRSKAQWGRQISLARRPVGVSFLSLPLILAALSGYARLEDKSRGGPPSAPPPAPGRSPCHLPRVLSGPRAVPPQC